MASTMNSMHSRGSIQLNFLIHIFCEILGHIQFVDIKLVAPFFIPYTQRVGYVHGSIGAE
jgi:hypothetical protein